MIIYSLFTIFFIFYLILVIKRAKKYRYNTHKDYMYNLEKNFINRVVLDDNSFEFDKNAYDTVFVKIELSFNFISYFLKPFIEIEHKKHYFEYGAKGIRYLNISHTQSNDIKLGLHNLTLNKQELAIYGYTNNINLEKDSLLILAPHADDAEIAGFGFYKSMKNVNIVTITIGEHGNCNYCDMYDNDEDKASLKKAELRTIDALTTGLYGGIKTENSMALGYFGGSLKWMRENPNKDASSLRTGLNDMNLFRRVSHSNINLVDNTSPNYNSFLNDLTTIIEQIEPDIIVTPHPIIDSHEDHKYTTYALKDVLKVIKHKCKILSYTNHLSMSESYPLGDFHSSISLPPNFKEFNFESIYSFGLSENLQVDKFFALESIHDLRDSSIQISIKKAYRQLNKLISRKIKGKDKSYYKRAIRANELFFVVALDDL